MATEEETGLLTGAPPPPSEDPSLMFYALREQDRVQSSQFVVVGFLLVVLAQFTATGLVFGLFGPYPFGLPWDFVEKGTLSNAAQDITTPHGRLFAVGLVFAGIFFLISNYTHYLYDSWAPDFSFEKNPFDISSLQPRRERRLRGIWLVFPQVGFMLTGASPALSNAQGTENILVILHSVLAPFSMLFMGIMETVQLYNEKAFARSKGEQFDHPLLRAPLTVSQRVRVVTANLMWIAGPGFLLLQAYMGVLRIFFTPNKSWFIAILSYSLEVSCLILAFFIPTAKAIEVLNFPTDDALATRSLRKANCHGVE